MVFDWDNKKNDFLKLNRKISFERIVIAIESGDLVDILEHTNKEKYNHQYLILVKIDGYVWVIPCIVDGNKYFMKTAYPSRKFTKIYLNGTIHEN